MNRDTIHVEPREVSEMEFHAAIQAATYPNRELPDPLWPGNVLEEVKATEPDCAAYRADKLRREAAEAPLHYGAGLTERDVEPVVRESARRGRLANALGAAVVALAALAWAIWQGVA